MQEEKCIMRARRHSFFICLFSFFFLFLTPEISPSILSGTLIKTCDGLIAVEDLCVGDYVIGVDPCDGSFINSRINKISKNVTDIVFIIETYDGLIYAPEDQLFYDPELDEWVYAQDLTPNNILIDYDGYDVPCLNIESLRVQAFVYEISLTSPHVFFASDLQILTHNYAAVGARFISFFGELVKRPEVVVRAARTVGAAVTGFVAKRVLRNQINKKNLVKQAAMFNKQQAVKLTRAICNCVKSNPTVALAGSLAIVNRLSKKSSFENHVDVIKVDGRTYIKPKHMKTSQCVSNFRNLHSKTSNKLPLPAKSIRSHVQQKQKQKQKQKNKPKQKNKTQTGSQGGSFGGGGAGGAGGNNGGMLQPPNKDPNKGIIGSIIRKLEDFVTVAKNGKITVKNEAVKKVYEAGFEKLGLQVISKGSVSHIRGRHFLDGANYLHNLTNGIKKASVFHAGENFIELAMKGLEKGEKLKPRVFIYNVGRIVGLDENGNPTTWIRVVLTETLKSIRTVFPF